MKEGGKIPSPPSKENKGVRMPKIGRRATLPAEHRLPTPVIKEIVYEKPKGISQPHQTVLTTIGKAFGIDVQFHPRETGKKGEEDHRASSSQPGEKKKPQLILPEALTTQELYESISALHGETTKTTEPGQPLTEDERLSQLIDAMFQRGKKDLLANLGKDGWGQPKAFELIEKYENRAIDPADTGTAETFLREEGWSEDTVSSYVNYLKEEEGRNAYKEMVADLGTQTLEEIIGIEGKKTALEEVRASGDEQAIKEKEIAIAQTIQKVIANPWLLPGKEDTYSFVDVLQDKQINCVMASVLESAMLEEVGIDHSIVSLHGHAIVSFISGDNLYMPSFSKDKIIEFAPDQSLSDDKSITVQDIITFTQHSQRGEVIVIDIPPNLHEFINDPRRSFGRTLVLSTPEAGLQTQIGVHIIDALEKQGNADEAIQLGKQLVAKEPKNPYVRYDLSHALFKKGDYKEAFHHLEVVLSATDTFPNANNLHGVLLTIEGKYKEALESYKKAVALAPSISDYWLNRSIVYFELGEYEKALADSRQAAIVCNSDDPSIWEDMATLQFRLNDVDGAIESVEHIVALIPENIDYKQRLGSLYFNLGKVDSSAAIFSELITMHPDLPNPYWYLARIEENANNKESAKELYLMHKEKLDSNDEYYRENLADVNAKLAEL